MRYNFTIAAAILCFPFLVLAQEYGQISTGASYANQSYYSFATGTETQVPNESWDLRFTALGGTDAGIHINESTTSSFTEPLPELELYLSPSQDFEDTVDPETLGDRIYNTEQSWQYGALNETRNESNPFDYGWGAYNPGTHVIEGTTVFVLKLRNGQYKKFMVTSLTNGAYNLRYADLDGSNEQTVSLNKSDSIGSFLYFSLEEDSLIEEVPTEWDLLFCRYTTPLDDGEGGILEYTVTGILSGPEVEVAEVTGIPSEEVDAETAAEYLTDLDVIGHDWKAYDFSEGWLLRDSTTYLIKTANNHIYKIVFVDFEGASTGTATFEVEDLGVVSSTRENQHLAGFSVFPNLIKSGAMPTLSFQAKNAIPRADILVYDLSGQVVQRSTTSFNQGLNAMQLPQLNLPAGNYFIGVQVEQDIITRKLIVH